MNATCTTLIYLNEVVLFYLWGDMELCTRTLDLKSFRDLPVKVTRIFTQLDTRQQILRGIVSMCVQ